EKSWKKALKSRSFFRAKRAIEKKPIMSRRPTRELSSNHYLVRYHVGPNQDGIRLDHFLKEHYRRRSREALKRSIEEGIITIERKQSPHLMAGKLKASSQLLFGDTVLVLSEKKPEPEVNFDYKVIY